VELDIPAAAALVERRASGLPIYLGGHSLGGQLMLLHVAATRPDIAGMALVACAIPYYRLWKGRSSAYIRFAALEFLFDEVPRSRGVRLEAALSEQRPGAHMRWARDPADVVRCLTGSLDGRAEAEAKR
jgi:predicted alpha/beta hydrolase